MNRLNIADNIARLRREKKITQEQLAEFIGVTKASVSKWETKQSTPDIILLPQLAAFFDVTVDELIGYKPQLSKEQIQKLYQEFAADFAQQPFEKVMAKTRDYIKRYYSCYPFLSQICVLWLNHYMMAANQERQAEILTSISELCDHIQSNCRDMEICNETLLLQALVHLQLGQAQQVIDMLEKISNPYKMTAQNGKILTQAYMMTGNMDKADSFTQSNMYVNILSLISNAASYLAIHAKEPAICEDTIIRIEQVIEIYNLAKLYPNTTAVFEYQATACYLLQDNKEKALKHLEKYVSALFELFSSDPIVLHGDNYFNKVEEWFDDFGNGANAPRSRKVVLDDAKHTLNHPVFDVLKQETCFIRLKTKLEELK